MNIDKILDFFYKKASDRIRIKVEESGLKHKDIYPKDSKQISWIINNNRTKNNRFLISDAIISNTDKDETKEHSYIKCGLLEKLNFNSIKEILWGTETEINSYIVDLFLLLWEELPDKNFPYGIDKELLLIDYIPYAKYHSYWEILLSPKNKYPALAYGVREDEVIENIDLARKNALKYLYDKCKSDFNNIFLSFTEKTLSYHKLDREIKKELITPFIEMLKKYEPNVNSLGLRVRDLINADLSHCAAIVCENKDLHFRKMIKASNSYILALEEIQKDIFLT